jgi:hypothetical protein
VILETPDGRRRTVQRIMFGTSWLGHEVRVIVVSRRRNLGAYRVDVAAVRRDEDEDEDEA